MNFVIENENGLNLGEKTLNKQGALRWTVSPMWNRLHILNNETSLYSNYCNNFKPEDKPEKYIYPLGVNNDPGSWAGGEMSGYDNYPDLFQFLPSYLIDDMKQGNAFLMVDSAFEGYHEQWIFDFFHQKSHEIGISPRQIIFVTGNSIIEEAYDEWLLKNKQSEFIRVIPYSCFEFDTYLFSQNLPKLNKRFPPTFNEHILHKEKNFERIKSFCNLNKKFRAHRKYFYALLYKHDLLRDGLVSISKIGNEEGFDTSFGKIFDENMIQNIKNSTPSLIYDTPNDLYDPVHYVQRFNSDVCLDTYLSVISEAQYEDEQKTVFLSEKIFKVIACSHPFIILGNKNSLKELRKLGYLTFGDYIDESYDTQNDSQRMSSIIKFLKSFVSMENKMDWYKNLQSILEHNKKQIEINAIWRIPYAVTCLVTHYHE